MDAYSSSAEVNTNLTSESSEPKDLGQEFISQTVVESTVDPNGESPVNPINQFCYNPSYVQFGQPFVTCEGFISLLVNKDVRIDINTNHSVCVTTPLLKASVDNFGHNIGVIHPFGRVYQEMDQNCVNIESGIHLAKMCGRGVTFTSLNRSLIYLVDTSGCKTTTERFRKLSYDFTADIFDANSLTGDYARQRAFADLIRHSFELSENRSEKFWNLSGI